MCFACAEMLLHITAGIKSGHRHALLRTALHPHLHPPHSHMHIKENVFYSLCQQVNLDLAKTLSQAVKLESIDLKQFNISFNIP